MNEKPIMTARELEIAALVAKGLNNREIAYRLVISNRTVQTHVSHILEKFALGNRTEIAMLAIYLDGGPANLPAAANDALEWMRFFNEKCRSSACTITAENQRKLAEAIALLEPMVADIAMVFQTTPEPQTEAGTVIVKEFEMEVERNAPKAEGEPHKTITMREFLTSTDWIKDLSPAEASL